MEINAQLPAVPYVFSPAEIEQIRAIFENPLILTYIKSLRYNVMVSRVMGKMDSVDDVLKYDNITQGKLEVLMELASVPHVLKSQLKDIAEQQHRTTVQDKLNNVQGA